MVVLRSTDLLGSDNSPLDCRKGGFTLSILTLSVPPSLPEIRHAGAPQPFVFDDAASDLQLDIPSGGPQAGNFDSAGTPFSAGTVKTRLTVTSGPLALSERVLLACL